MILNRNGYEQYKTQSINTMTNSELLIVLYDELLKRLKRAEFALDNGDFAMFDQSVTRCKEIVKHLEITLDKSYPIAEEISRLYEFLQYQLARLQSGRRKEIIKEIEPFVIQFRDAFKEASKVV